MGQNITWLGSSYTDVQHIDLPKTGGGVAYFHDVTPTTATDSDVASGKIYFKSDGTQSTGTASGGGGGSNWTLLASKSVTCNTTSTSQSELTTLSCGTGAFTKDDIIFVHIRGESGKRSGYFYGSDAIFCNYQAANGSTTTFSAPAIEYYRVSSSGTFTTATGSYGVYGYSISSSGTVSIRRRYNSTNTLTINDTFDISVYKLTLPNNEKVFP